MRLSRYELARLCGYPTYSHRVLDHTLLNKPEHVTNYLEQIMNAIRPLADRDIQLMQILKNRLQPLEGEQRPVAPWDVSRLESKFKSDMCVHRLGMFHKDARLSVVRSSLQINPHEYTPYFSLGSCMEGLNLIFRSLFR